MQLRDEEQRFIRKRSRLLEAWRYVGVILLIVLLGLGIWLFLSKPMLGNPFAVMSRLQSGSISQSTLFLMAGMLPIVVLMCIGLSVAVVLSAYAAFSNEKKYISIIQRESLKTDVTRPVDPGSNVKTIS